MDQFGLTDSKFRLAILIAKRAKQLISGSKQRIEIIAENPLTIAIEEIAQGKVDFEILDKEEMIAREELMKENAALIENDEEKEQIKQNEINLKNL